MSTASPLTSPLSPQFRCREEFDAAPSLPDRRRYEQSRQTAHQPARQQPVENRIAPTVPPPPSRRLARPQLPKHPFSRRSALTSAARTEISARFRPYPPHFRAVHDSNEQHRAGHD